MKNTFKLYLVAWGAVFALFNAISFIIPNTDRAASFWIGYVFISLTLVGQLICAYQVFRGNNAKKMFYGLSLIKITYTGLVVSLIFGGLCMAIKGLPYWVGVIVCAIVLVANLLSILKATVAIKEVERIDTKIKTQTAFIKLLTVDADTLMASASSEADKAACRKVCEAVRYSDPMSCDALSAVEAQMTLKFAELSEAVKAADTEKVSQTANEMLILIGDRNNRCKILK